MSRARPSFTQVVLDALASPPERWAAELEAAGWTWDGDAKGDWTRAGLSWLPIRTAIAVQRALVWSVSDANPQAGLVRGRGPEDAARVRLSNVCELMAALERPVCAACAGTGQTLCADCGNTGEHDDGERCDTCWGDGAYGCESCGGICILRDDAVPVLDVATHIAMARVKQATQLAAAAMARQQKRIDEWRSAFDALQAAQRREGENAPPPLPVEVRR